MTPRWIRRGLAALGMTGLAALATADTDPTAWAPSQFTLDNGMAVLVLPDHRAPVVTHMVWYRVGAMDEAPGKSGIAHLFEHVMFKQTDDIADGEFDRIVTRSGGRSNAGTSWDYTVYYEQVAKQHLATMMALEAERMTDLIIDEDPEGSFITERDVVKEERRQTYESSPSRMLQEKVFAEFFRGHPYEISIIGRMEEVGALTPQDGQAFYDTFYSPENAILVVAGDVTPDEVRRLAEEHYGPKQPSGLVSDRRNWQALAPLDRTVAVIHTDPKVRQPVWSRYYDGTSLLLDRDRALALEVGLQVLGGGSTSLLYQRLVEEQKLAISVGSAVYSFLRDGGPALIYASPSPGVSLETLETAVMQEIAALLEAGFDPADVQRVRNTLAADAIYQRDSQMSMARSFGAWVTIGGDVQDLLDYPNDVRAVTTEQALAAVRQVFRPDAHHIEARLLPDMEDAE